MPPRHALGLTTIRRRYTTLNGVLRFHWTGERVRSGKPTIFGHRWEDVLHQVNGETHDFEGFGTPAWGRFHRGDGGVWILVWPCLDCGAAEMAPARHVHHWPAP
jgi:hypothetical protein